MERQKCLQKTKETTRKNRSEEYPGKKLEICKPGYTKQCAGKIENYKEILAYRAHTWKLLARDVPSLIPNSCVPSLRTS